MYPFGFLSLAKCRTETSGKFFSLPRMSECLFCAVPHARGLLHHVPYEILRWGLRNNILGVNRCIADAQQTCVRTLCIYQIQICHPRKASQTRTAPSWSWKRVSSRSLHRMGDIHRACNDMKLINETGTKSTHTSVHFFRALPFTCLVYTRQVLRKPAEGRICAEILYLSR